MSPPELSTAEQPSSHYEFGEFLLDLAAGFLHRGSEVVPLPPKPFELLAYLVKHHGRLVTKTELIAAVWPDTAITDNSLAQCLREVRRALGDEAQQMIRTVTRRGYVFAASVTITALESADRPADPDPKLPHIPSARLYQAPYIVIGTVLLLVAAIITGLLLARRYPSPPGHVRYTQLTNFTDSAVAPALSPDGRMVAFLRSDNWFHTPDAVYVKMLPDGEPVLLTRDSRLKYGLAFSLDGFRIAYTVLDDSPPGWNTVTLSPLGGEPRLFMLNASGLSWLTPYRLLFSEVSSGVHMGVVTAKADRSESRRLYFPPHERSMVHLSYPSPDRQWALLLEMNPVWQPCRVIPLSGNSTGRQVGPTGKCTSAGWSPDGKWMYLGVEVQGEHHLWRQRFPQGEPEQITFGPTEEDGIAVAPDGASLITSIGLQQTAVWIRDARGERPLTSEGYVGPMRVSPYSSVRFSPDGKSLYYLVRRDSPSAASELWRMDLQSQTSAPALPGVSMADYDVSSDGREVVFSTPPSVGHSQLWIAPLSRSAPPRRIAAIEGAWPHFGPDGHVLFQRTDGKANYLARTRRDGSNTVDVFPEPVGNIYGTSPDRRWILVGRILPDGSARPLIAVPTEGGAARTLCENPCHPVWAPDGSALYVGMEPSSRTARGKTLVIPLPSGEMLPKLPAAGIRTLEEGLAIPGTRIVDAWNITPGPDPSTFAYVKATMHRNLFRISLSSGL